MFVIPDLYNKTIMSTIDNLKYDGSPEDLKALKLMLKSTVFKTMSEYDMFI
jgi:hypothetical protein